MGLKLKRSEKNASTPPQGLKKEKHVPFHRSRNVTAENQNSALCPAIVFNLLLSTRLQSAAKMRRGIILGQLSKHLRSDTQIIKTRSTKRVERQPQACQLMSGGWKMLERFQPSSGRSWGNADLTDAGQENAMFVCRRSSVFSRLKQAA